MEVTNGSFTAHNFLNIGRGSNQDALLNLSGGTVQMAPTSVNHANLNSGSNNLVVINLSGGNLNTANPQIVLNTTATSSNNTAIINVSGTGTLSTNQITSGAATSGTGRLAMLNFNGGTLRAQGTAPGNFINIIDDGTVADSRSGTYLYAGGATIDTNGIDTIINTPTVRLG